MGGGKGGFDFDFKGKSDNEICCFCVFFMCEFVRYIGVDIDVFVGDIGVGGCEIGYMFGVYCCECNKFIGVFIGKGFYWGGFFICFEVIGFGFVYYVGYMFEYVGVIDGWKNKCVFILGFGNVVQYVVFKVIEFGGKVVFFFDFKGFFIVIGEQGVIFEDIVVIVEFKFNCGFFFDYSYKDNFKYIDGVCFWVYVGKVDIVFFLVIQNEVSKEEVEVFVVVGCKFIVEGFNMGCIFEVIEVFENECCEKKGEVIWYVFGKVVNCGGVVVFGFEMFQNSQCFVWIKEEVDSKFKEIMKCVFFQGFNMVKEYVEVIEGEYFSLVVGFNIVGFVKVVCVMKEIGDWWDNQFNKEVVDVEVIFDFGFVV